MNIERIKSLREDGDKTQQQLADYLHLTQSAYSNYENGLREIPLQVLFSLADFYETSVDYLLGRTNQTAPYSPSNNR